MALQTQKSSFPKLDDFQTAFALAQWALTVYQNLPTDSPDRAFFVSYFQDFLTQFTPTAKSTTGLAVTTGSWNGTLTTSTNAAN